MEKSITALETQKRNPDRINVFLDGEFAFGVSRFVGAWLTVGQKIDGIKVESLISSDEKEKALQSALRFIGYKQRTESEVIKKLNQLECSAEIIESVILELKEKRYLDDGEFASQWIEIRGETKPRGRNLLKMELRRKGIAGEIIEAAIKNAPDEMDMAVSLGKKYLKRYSSINDVEFRKKMTGILSRRAFPYSIVNDTINALINIRNEESEK